MDGAFTCRDREKQADGLAARGEPLTRFGLIAANMSNIRPAAVKAEEERLL